MSQQTLALFEAHGVYRKGPVACPNENRIIWVWNKKFEIEFLSLRCSNQNI